MSTHPIIGLCQQPCGFFPKRFLFAKIQTARRLQTEIGGEIVFFYHDSDHDPRETKTVLRHHKTNQPLLFNFAYKSKLQRKYTPLYLKPVLPEWHSQTLHQLPEYVGPQGVEAFKNTPQTNVADFCLEIYYQMGILSGIRTVRSSDVVVREQACEVGDFFVDVPYFGEVVRARRCHASLKLHQGGDAFLDLPPTPFEKSQISPTRDTRIKWMQSVLNCTHYVAGAGEMAYMNPADTPEITFLPRDPIDRLDEAYTEFQS